MHYEFEHDVERIFASLSDPQFLVDRCLELGELEAGCEIAQEGERIEISLARKVKRDLPRFLARILDPVQTMLMTECWQPDGEGGWSGDYTVEVEGHPVTITANFELYPTDDGCCYSIEHQAKAKIPLISGKVEKYVLGQATEGCTAELDYLREHLE